MRGGHLISYVKPQPDEIGLLFGRPGLKSELDLSRGLERYFQFLEKFKGWNQNIFLLSVDDLMNKNSQFPLVTAVSTLSLVEAKFATLAAFLIIF